MNPKLSNAIPDRFRVPKVPESNPQQPGINNRPRSSVLQPPSSHSRNGTEPSVSTYSTSSRSRASIIAYCILLDTNVKCQETSL